MSDSKKFRDWDDRYAASDYLFGTAPNDFLKSVAERLPPNSRILCMADGEGRNGVYLATLGHKVTALDQSRVGLVENQNQMIQKDQKDQTQQIKEFLFLVLIQMMMLFQWVVH